MKGGNRILLGLAAIALAMVYAGCSKDEDALRFGEARQAERTGTLGDARGGALRSGSSVVIDFKGFASSMMAGPSSYGENYYSASASLQVKSITNGVFTSTVNSHGGSVEFWNGGIALSKWNYYSNQGDSSLPDDWWYSYMNQMSVYNSHSQDGSNKGAGHRGDDNFGVVFGYVDSYNQQG